MQEKLLEKKYIRPELSSIDKIRQDIKTFGYCLESTKKQIIDEEKTQAAEILATRNYKAEIPRIYRVLENDLVNEYGVSLKSVLDNGIDYLHENPNNKIGHDWEIRRRRIERNNLEKIISCPEGIACIEISSTDLARPKNELLEQGYTGDSLLRVSYKNNNQVCQKNIILKTSDVKTLNMLRKRIDKNAQELSSSEEILRDVLYVSVDPENFDNLCADLHNFVDSEFQKKTPAKFMASIIRKAKQKNKDAWSTVNSHNKIFDEMFMMFEELALSRDGKVENINAIRAGCWQALLEASVSSRNKVMSIDSGVARARAVGSVFTSCGGTVSFEASSNYSGGFLFFERYDTVRNLLGKTHSIGLCRSCGRTSLMHGCGVYCGSCNRVWCNVYLRTGKQLSDKEISQTKYLAYFRI